MFHFKSFNSAPQLMAYLMDYIQFYNNKRRHSSLGYLSPHDFENKVA